MNICCSILHVFLQELRKIGVVGKFVEFFGPGVANLSVADRATISNMAPEQGCTAAFFPCDYATMDYLKQTGENHFADRSVIILST